MKKISIFLLLLFMISLSYAQQPNKLAMEPLNSKIITARIATTGAADITIPLFIAPCNGYIPLQPRMSSTSGTAAGDTTTALYWEFYIIAHDSVATAVTDTIAYWTTKSSTGAYTMAALKNYKFTWLSASTSRILTERDVVALRCNAVGATPTAVTNILIEFIFIPTTRRDNLK